MDAANGVGLAANQIGVSQRVFVYDCADERGRTTRRRGVVVNPVLETSEIPETMPDPDNDDEGCLSVPGESFPTGRANWARVTGLDADGNPVELEGTELFARMLQHETGHLDGFLYVDSLIGRHARAAKRAVKAQRLGRARPELDAGRGPRPVRALPCHDLPPVGTRVSLRYRLPAGSVPPLSDVVGHLLDVGADHQGAHQVRCGGRRFAASTWSRCAR